MLILSGKPNPTTEHTEKETKCVRVLRRCTQKEISLLMNGNNLILQSTPLPENARARDIHTWCVRIPQRPLGNDSMKREDGAADSAVCSAVRHREPRLEGCRGPDRAITPKRMPRSKERRGRCHQGWETRVCDRTYVLPGQRRLRDVEHMGKRHIAGTD